MYKSFKFNNREFAKINENLYLSIFNIFLSNSFMHDSYFFFFCLHKSNQQNLYKNQNVLIPKSGQDHDVYYYKILILDILSRICLTLLFCIYLSYI